jgi:uncharacterized protein (TIGR02611 family)
VSGVSEASGDRDDRPELLVKLQERKERHKQRHIVHRVAVVIFGFLVVLVGIFLSGPGVPGPGFLVILIGLGFLALEFDRAERLLERIIDRVEAVRDRTSAAQEIALALVGVAALAAYVVAAVVWEIPVLPG